jgi:hypothetical protein
VARVIGAANQRAEAGNVVDANRLAGHGRERHRGPQHLPTPFAI